MSPAATSLQPPLQPPLEETKERVGAELADVCGHLNVLHERMVALTRELLDTGAWEADTGCRTPEQYLAWRTGLSPERAAQIVMIARRRHELPATFGAFAAGLLSVDQVAVVARRVPQHNDAEACELARSATVAQLRVGLGKHFLVHPTPASPEPSAGPGAEPNVDPNGDSPTDPATDPNANPDRTDPARSGEPATTPTPPPPPPPAPECERRLAVGFDDDGNFFLRGLTNGLDGAVIQQSLAEAKDALFADGHTDVTWMDALVEVCRRSLAGVASPSRRDLYSVVVHLDSEGAWIHNGPALPSALLEHVTCDGGIRPLWSSAGLAINLGRTQHVVPRRTRLVVEDRDRVCRHPTCTSSAHLQIHHVIHWTQGGATDTNNLVCLCSRHHHAHHRGEFTITGNADAVHADGNAGEGNGNGDGDDGGGGLVFRDARGNVIRSCGVPNPPGERPPPEPTSPYAHPTGERLQLRWLSFTPPPDADAPDIHEQN